MKPRAPYTIGCRQVVIRIIFLLDLLIMKTWNTILLHLVHGKKNLKVMDLSSCTHYLQGFLIAMQENLEIITVIISMELEQCHGKMK